MKKNNLVTNTHKWLDHGWMPGLTCWFAQRIAMVSNVVGVNEEVDPTLIIKRLKAENKELKDQLKLLSGEEEREITESEIDRLRGQVMTYCEARGPDAELDLGAGPDKYCSPRHPTHFEPSSLESHDIL